MMEIVLLKYPTDEDWMEAKCDALVTAGKKAVTAPDINWKHKMLVARHSPIRSLKIKFELRDIPYWLSTEFSRHHAGCEKFIKSQRNDRQENYDRNAARQDAPVNMRWELNAESMMIIANKRLCMKATEEARKAVREMCRLLIEQCPEFDGVLVPMCGYHGGVCHEIQPCGLCRYDGMGGNL